VNFTARTQTVGAFETKIEICDPVGQVSAAPEGDYQQFVGVIGGDKAGGLTIGCGPKSLLFVFEEFYQRNAHSSNSSIVSVDAASTRAQFPTEHDNSVPVELRFSKQYAAALYCAKRSRLPRTEAVTSMIVSSA
jgi:hypothetical protein